MPGFRARQCESCILFYLFWLSKIIFSESYLEICVGRERENYIFKREHMLLQSKNKQAKKHRCRQNMCSRENIFLKNEPHILICLGGYIAGGALGHCSWMYTQEYTYIGSTQEIYVVLWIETVSAAWLFNACIHSRSLWPLILLSVHCAAFENKVKYKNKSQMQYPHQRWPLKWDISESIAKVQFFSLLWLEYD